MKLLAVFLAVVWSSTPVWANDDGWKLVWSDDFSQGTLDDHPVWGPEEYPPLMFNREKQAYTSRPENAFVKDGALSIEARKDGGDGFDVTSARLTTDRRLSVLYGRIEFRARLPKGTGTWPALWMLPQDSSGHGHSWPDSGEIDVMESVGFEGDCIHGSLHTANFNHVLHTQVTATAGIQNIADWHIYAVEWLPDHIDFLVDGRTYLTFRKNGDDWRDWPFDKPFYLIMNVAIGGTWGGMKGVDDHIFPARMDVSWVRIYQRPDVPGSEITVQ